MLETLEPYISVVFHFIFVMTLGWYLITNLQWYNYKIERIVFHHKKQKWHIIHFALPIIAYYFTKEFFPLFYIFAQAPAIISWHKKLDKPLILTARVKRFFLFLSLSSLSFEMICFNSCLYIGVLDPLIVAFIISLMSEKLFNYYYRSNAKAKLKSFKDLKIVTITASYGKTSIKNILYHFTSAKLNSYATPRSVNTEMGLVADINNNLSKDIELYIAEAGARKSGDIKAISYLLEHQYAIVGKIGSAHIEYFKNETNIKRAKREIFLSDRLIKAVVHESAEIKKDNMIVFGAKADIKIENINATLNGTSWDIVTSDDKYHISTSLLGSFNATNVTAAFLMAKELGIDTSYLINRAKTIQPIEHRLQLIHTGGKLIIDDSFNGNLEGMLEAARIASTYKGKKIIVTPGIVESNEESNSKFAKVVNEIFDIVIISSDVNKDIFAKFIDNGKKRRVFSKQGMEKILEIESSAGDLILFANDAPNFV